MGCNFYWKSSGEHIGKRSATGPYCYNCSIKVEPNKRWIFKTVLGVSVLFGDKIKGFEISLPKLIKLHLRLLLAHFKMLILKLILKIANGRSVLYRIKSASEHIRCPICNTVYFDEPIPRGASLELGFRNKPLQFTRGLHSSSGFTFAQNPTQILLRLSRRSRVVDKYGRKYTPDEFRQVLAGCVIQNFDLIGQEFC